MKTVVIGMSGGVDSSVSALLLKRQGYRVIGLFMKNWEEDADGKCCAASDFEDVASVCEKLDIPYYTVNFTQEYQEKVFKEMLQGLQEGITPNPDILCNREIKFGVFLQKAKKLGADFLATGHYCKTKVIDGNVHLLKGTDLQKDQSYFLSAVKEEALKEVLFPIGEMRKSEVRKLAAQAALPTATKKDSTGICFIGKREFKDFLSNYLPFQPGVFEDTSGKIIGTHQGTAFYTIGQRKGLKIGGRGDAWFVVGKDILRNVVIVEQGSSHPALFSQSLIAKNPSWVVASPPSYPFQCLCKIRYRQEDQACIIHSSQENELAVEFLKPQRAVTPGQSIVFYQGNICLGSAIIV